MLGEAPTTFPPALVYWSMLWMAGCIAFVLVVLVTLLHRNDKKPPAMGHFGPIIRPAIRSRVPGGRQER